MISKLDFLRLVKTAVETNCKDDVAQAVTPLDSGLLTNVAGGYGTDGFDSYFDVYYPDSSFNESGLPIDGG